MNQLDIVNKILRRLRGQDGEVATVAEDAYSQLIAEFVNEGIEEVQSAYLWSSLEQEVEFDTTVDVAEYDLQASTSDNSMLKLADGAAQFFIYEGAEFKQKPLLVAGTDIDKATYEGPDHSATPTMFSVRRNATQDGLEIKLYPIPDKVYTVKTKIWIPQEHMEIDGSDDATDILVPWEPVFAYAFMTALNERGEEMGEPGNLAERRFINALGAAIELEISYLGAANVYEFWRD